MSYSGATQARQAREALGGALAALQEDPNIPQDVMAVAQNIALSVGALFEAERASSEPDGKACVRNALSSLSQTLALLQDVRGQHRGVAVATETIAQTMSALYPLTTIPSKVPPPPQGGGVPVADIPRAAPVPQAAPAHNWQAAAQPAAPAPHQAAPAAARPAPAGGPRPTIEANIGATTESNFYVGFSGEISEGGVFLATYEMISKGAPVQVLVTLPGGFELHVDGVVRFVRDPLDFSADSEPGIGIQFTQLDPQARELILRFIRKRPPIFYDD